MAETNRAEMSADDRDAFLGIGGTGVLSLAVDEETAPYAAPVSYGYDPEESVFYFRLAANRDSEKGYLDGRPVTFVTYGDGEEPWQSVVASGRLEDASRDDITSEVLDGFERVDIPLVDVFDRPVREVTFEFFRLVPDELTAREELQRGT
ncbi:pyridoxamine 5'-phosphate oxidase family protein [Haloarcula salina]|uniref:pyridoxamine 5'-phosphate oxidase family protein n=1 Tax=Haloarcula salina TaxID=1429914 RepID=UPI003C6FC28C